LVFRKKQFDFFIGNHSVLILAGYRSNELYQESLQFHLINWQKILEPIYIIGGIPVMIYFCIVGIWLIFVLKKELNRTIGMTIGKQAITANSDSSIRILPWKHVVTQFEFL